MSILVNNYELFRYDEPTYYWENVKNPLNNFAELEQGRGYIYANADSITLNINGELNTVVVYQELSTSGELLTGFNLIGNPYMHDIYKGNGSAIYDRRLANGFYTLTNEGAWYAKLDNVDAIKPTEGLLV